MDGEHQLTGERGSGILLPVFSLPSRHGIGTFGRAAYAFVDFLAAAKQRWWQVLPLGCTGFGDSPYQSFSAFAGNPYFIDLDMLTDEGLLEAGQADAADWGDDPGRVDYGKLWLHRGALLRRAFERGRERDAAAVRAFREENDAWLPDYALYMALKARGGMRPWTEWDDVDIRMHDPDAVRRCAQALREEIDACVYTQYLFFKQWRALKSYANSRGVGILGDLPIYVAMDSADVWARRGDYCLDEAGRPTEVAGVPPDYFSATGQLWGNPLYDWARMRGDGYAWWLRRLDFACAQYDAVRIDHFRGFESYWAVPFGAETARDGRWAAGPGMDFIGALRRALPGAALIAEDLGTLTDGVRAMVRASGLPGMKVLEFAFAPDNAYLPHRHVANSVCYTGTHDNAPLTAWAASLGGETRDFAMRYLGAGTPQDIPGAVLRAGLGSVAGLFVAQLQDWMELGAEARVNLPGTCGGNWTWRLRAGEPGGGLAPRIASMTCLYGRAR
ncbi:MAG: 4-alpha-glucanotransferase [Oscillospiraceae bacterium]|nr:4-alpha-glucanotransferase [Oscillospiraceae bacterium]